MFSQPFCLQGNRVFFCNETLLVGILDLSEATPEPIPLVLPCDPPCMYTGAALSQDHSTLLAADKIHPRLVCVSPEREGFKESDLSDSGMAPSSVAFANGKIWLTINEGDFDTKLAWVDIQDLTLHFALIDEGWDPPALNMHGFPVVLSHYGELVLYSPLRHLLYWLDDDCSIQATAEIPEDAVLGPDGEGGLLFITEAKGRKTLWRIERTHEIKEVRKLVGAPGESADGVAMTQNGRVLILGESRKVHMSAVDSEKWRSIEFPTPAQAYEAYARQVMAEWRKKSQT
ncbi:MAG: hypothetical protein QGD94_06750 [Planctomycetia bacterium]|nr:hypothetical protein [Planctomycetia bacterium]